MVTEGEAYGFSIGMTKEQTYAAAESQNAGKTVYMRNLLNDKGVHATSHTT